ncbi:MAG: cobaltochelatase subunit CobN [Cyanobacteria bacterium J06635_15]
MHRLAASPGGWNPEAEGVIFVDQTPAPLVFLTAADTEIQILATVLPQLPKDFPAIRVTNLLQLQQQLSIDTYAETVLSQALVIVVRLLGGRAYWSYGLEVLKDTAATTGAKLVVLPGDDRPDPDLISHSTVPLATANQIWRYLIEGGVDNLRHGLAYLCDRLLNTHYNPPAPNPIPRLGVYHPSIPPLPHPPTPPSLPAAGLLFYRSHYLSGNTAPIDALCKALTQQGLQPVPIFVSSLQDPDTQTELLTLLKPKGEPGIQVLLITTSFSIAQLDQTTPQLDLWQKLDVPILQVILSGGTQDQWQTNPQGLSPRDIAMNVALPEVDGRIITRAISFKAVQRRSSALETDVVVYEPVSDRVQFVAQLAAHWVHLRQTPPAERRIALILANYPTRDARLANGVGLDTPQSCVEILHSLATAGYHIPDIPKDGDDLIQRLTQSITNDREANPLRPAHQTLTPEAFENFFNALPKAVKTGIRDRWPASPTLPHSPTPPSSPLPIPGLQLGNLFIGIQPSRGYDQDPTLNYHAPDLEPTPEYLAFYAWVRHQFGAQAIVHIGKHGNLEWLPGKGIALSENCYPEAALGPLPHLYPFIVNDPGEGAQAKRRAQAVIVDHLTPPLTRAELYGPLEKLEALVDEYYEAQSLDPTRLPMIGDRIGDLLAETQLVEDLGLGKGGERGRGGGGESGGENQNSSDKPIRQAHDKLRTSPKSKLQNPLAQRHEVLSKIDRPKDLDKQGGLETLLPQIDGYLCELKEAQIRDGLHIFGCCPEGRQLRDLLIAIARHPSPGRVGLTRAIAQDYDLNIDPLTDDLALPFAFCPPQLSPTVCDRPLSSPAIAPQSSQDGVIQIKEPDLDDAFSQIITQHQPTLLTALENCRTIGDAVTQLEIHAATLVDAILSSPTPPLPRSPTPPALIKELTHLHQTLLPNLRQTPQELTHLLHGLNGGYIPSGPAGAPTRNRPDVLPTGRNFYSVDIRAIPTESAWDVGRRAAEVLIEDYVQQNGEYPKTLGLSVWGTSTMRTGGDDLAEALALLGVRPVWDGPSRRVVDFEILPVSLLGRPRVDVTLRISGFFRDGFPNLIDLFDQAVAAVASLDEPDEQNPLAARVQQETAAWIAKGLTEEQAQTRSRFRIFGSKPGAYGAGLQGLIDAQNWTTDADLARAYVNWSSYAYGRNAAGRSAPEAFQQRLEQMQIVLHNQDNREHDLLDSDDYYQFQGGLTAAVRVAQGKNPQTYFGDHAVVDNPKVRSLQAEIARVYRSRVVNPKWIAGVMRHGYKGAFEMAATVDYLFAYDATTHCVADYMYQGVAETYVLDPKVQQFIEQKNPWALRDMAERLLEASQRGLWQGANVEVLDQLRAIAHQAEAQIE